MSLKERGYIGDEFWGQARKWDPKTKPACQGRHDVGSNYLVFSMGRQDPSRQFYMSPVELKVLCVSCGKTWWKEKPLECNSL